jgi:hypothetical protein
LHGSVLRCALAMILCTGASAAFAAGGPDSSAVSVTVTVTALGPGFMPVVIPKEQLTVSSGRSQLTVTDWKIARGDANTLQLAILIDNNVKPLLTGASLRDLADFVKSQPSTVSIGVFFAEKGKATQAVQFTTDHQAAAEALTESTPDSESLRVYPSLSDLAAHWPTPGAAHREILMIGSGYDALINGMVDPNLNSGLSEYAGSNYDSNVSGERDPYLNSMIEGVERAGIVVHSIYVADPRFQPMVEANIMRDKLIEVSTETGGLAFFKGESADSFAGYLRELTNALQAQYLLTLTTDRSHKAKGEFRALHVTVTDPSVTMFAPQQVFIPSN